MDDIAIVISFISFVFSMLSVFFSIKNYKVEEFKPRGVSPATEVNRPIPRPPPPPTPPTIRYINEDVKPCGPPNTKLDGSPL